MTITIPTFSTVADEKYLRQLTDTLKQIQSKITDVEGDVTNINISSENEGKQQLKTPKYDGANSTVALGTNSARAMFLGYAYRDFIAGEIFKVRWRIAIAGSGLTWAELAIAKGDHVLGVNPAVRPVGFYSWGTEHSAAAPANYTSSVPISSGQSIAAGDGLWVVFAKNSTGSPTLAAGGAFDVLQSGIHGTNTTVGWRPSLNIGTLSTFTTDTASLPIMANVTTT